MTELHEKTCSFEMYRRGNIDVEILTFDELLERTRFILQSQNPSNENLPTNA